MASRILGMGDILGLIEKVDEEADVKEGEEIARKLGKEEFTLEDFRKQLKQIRKMGSFSQILKHLPSGGMFKNLAGVEMDDGKILHYEAMIGSLPAPGAQEPGVNGGR